MSVKNASDEVARALPVFLGSVAKRFLEGTYDRAIQTELGQKLVALSPSKKYGVEAVLYALTAWLDLRLKANSKLAQIAREVAIDAAPEIAKRMINGARQEISEMAAKTKSPEEKDLLTAFLSLEDGLFKNLLDLLYNEPADKRQEILAQFFSLPPDQQAKWMGLSEDERKKFFAIFIPQKPTGERGLISESTRESMRRLAEKIRIVRQRRRER